MVNASNPQSEFDAWSTDYDRAVGDDGTFPFDGYDRVLHRVLDLAEVTPGQEILELGPGTGNLTRLLLDSGAAVWGLDFSEGMLTVARQKTPEATLVQGHVLEPLPAPLDRRYDRIVGTYVLHEFPLSEKVSLVARLVEQHLAPGGRLIFGDIGFADNAARSIVREHTGAGWDEEFYWLADETAAAFEPHGLQVQFEQLSSCGVVVSLSHQPATR